MAVFHLLRDSQPHHRDVDKAVCGVTSKRTELSFTTSVEGTTCKRCLSLTELHARGGSEDDPLIDFGKHKGKPVSKVPAEYLRWIGLNVKGDYWARIVKKEMERRGTKPKVTIKPSAVDDFSLTFRGRDIWIKCVKTTKGGRRGIWSFVARRAKEAFELIEEKPEVGSSCKQEHVGLSWVFYRTDDYHYSLGHVREAANG
jgi:hypothetical protein